MRAVSSASAGVSVSLSSPVREHVGAVGEADGELRPLLDEQDRDAALPDLRQRGEDILDDRRRKPEGGLVEEEKVGPGDERPRDRKLLLLPAGEHARRAVAVPADDGEEGGDAREVILGAVPRAAADQPQPEILLDRELREDLPSLGHERDSRAHDRVRPEARERPPERAGSPRGTAGRRP